MKKTLTLLCLAVLMTVTAMASGPFREHRWESFHGLKPAENSIVFVGNSITNMHDWWEAFGGNHQILNRGTSGGFTTEVLPHLEMILEGHPAKVFIGIGTNDVTSSEPAVVAENIRLIITRIRKESPNTEVYMQSVLPSTNGNRGARIVTLNNLVKPIVEELNKEYGKVTYLDVFSQLVATDGVSFKTYNGKSLAFDNLHPTVIGYGIWCNTIAPQVGSNCVYDINASTIYNGGQNNSTGDRITCFAQQVVNANDILILGDEMVSSGEWHEWLQSDKVKNRGLGWGYPGSNIDQLITNASIYFQHAKSVAPKAILVYAGISEASSSVTAANFKTKCQNLINALRKKAPQTKIYFITPLNTPTASYNNNLKSYITQLNSLTSNSNVKVIDATSMNGNAKYFYVGDGGNYFTSYGYAKLSQIIETALKQDFNDLDIKAVTDEECTKNNELYAARKVLGDVLTDAFRNSCKIGDGVGEYSAAAMGDLNAKIDEACAMLAAGTATPAELQAKANELKSITPQINMPKASTDGDEHWYTMCSSNRGSRYLVSNGSNVVGTTDGNKYAKGQWKLVARTDGTFDIVNREDGKYIATSTYDNPINLSASAPSTGWTFSGCDAAGMFNIQNGSCEINMTNSAVSGGYKVVNWSNGGTGNDKADTGCQFTLAEVDGDPEPVPEPVGPQDGKSYTIRASFKSGATSLYLINQNGSVRTTATKPSDNTGVWNIVGTAIQSASNPNQYLYVNAGMKLNNTPNEIVFAEGLTEGTYGISYVTRFAAVNSNGTVDGGQFTGAQYNEYSGWTTDFIFEEAKQTSPDEDKLLEEAKAAYKEAVETADALAEKYADSNDATVQAALKALSDALKANTVAETGTIEQFKAATEAIDAALRTARTAISQALDENTTYTIDKNNGRFTATNGNGTWASTWASNDDLLKFTASANNMAWSGDNIDARCGTAGTSTYAIEPADKNNYVITGYSLKLHSNGASSENWTINDKSYTSTSTTDVKEINVTGIEERRVEFTETGTNAVGTLLYDFTVTMKYQPRDPSEVDYDDYMTVFDTHASSVPYRIPAVGQTKDGDLIFVADYRYSHADIGAGTKLDLKYRKQYADGTWGQEKTLAAYIPQPFCAFGDPCIVCDRESNRVMVTSCCGNVGFPGGTYNNHQGWARWYSEDGGETWESNFTDLAPQVVAWLDKRKNDQMQAFFIGSGKISQSSTVKVGKYYRLYCASNTRMQSGKCNFVWYSDDFGETWNMLGDPDVKPINGGDEPKADEMPDGSVVVSSRDSGRIFNVYHYTNIATGEGYWGKQTTSSSNNKGCFGASCNGEIMFVPVTRVEDGAKTYLALQSVPMSGSRVNVGIYWKDLKDLSYYRTSTELAPNWTAYQISETTSAYSTMCQMQDGHIAFFYEENGHNDGYDMVYKKFDISKITKGKYTYSVLTDEEKAQYLSNGVDPYFEGKTLSEKLSKAIEAYKANPTYANYEVLNEAVQNPGGDIPTPPTPPTPPTEGTYCTITAVFPNGNEHIIFSDGEKLTAAEEAPEGAFTQFVVEQQSDENVVLKVGDNYMHWSSGDNAAKSDDLDGLNEEFDESLNTLIIRAGNTDGLQSTTWDSEPIASLSEILGYGTDGQLYNFTLREKDDEWIAGDAGMKFYDDNWDGIGCRTSYFRIEVFEINPDGINVLRPELQDAIRFDLQGRRINGNARGIVLQNGSKKLTSK